jgi:hypothetical protein
MAGVYAAKCATAVPNREPRFYGITAGRLQSKNSASTAEFIASTISLSMFIYVVYPPPPCPFSGLFWACLAVTAIVFFSFFRIIFSPFPLALKQYFTISLCPKSSPF